MIRRHLMMLRVALMVVDALTATLVFVVVSLVRFGDGDDAALWQLMGIDLRVAAAMFAAVWVLALEFLGLYRLRVRWRFATEAKDIARATFLVLAVTLSALFVFHLDNVSRFFLILLFVVQPLVTLTGRAALRKVFGVIRRRGYNKRFMLVVGTGRLAQSFADRVEGRPALGIQVVGHLSIPGQPDSPVTRPILGSLGMISAVFRLHVIDEVAVCLPATALHHVEPISRLAADEGKTVRIPVDPIAELFPTTHQEEFEGFLVRSLFRDDQRALGLVIKRWIDIVGAIGGLILFGPVLLLAAVAIRLADGSPVLFRQTRVGLHGRPFTIVKFRTMNRDAEQRYPEIAALSDTKGAAFKMTRDPRVTPLGRLLRKASIDELPQLINVLQGEMSLVGPRPAPPREVDGYDIWHRRRLSMKPGISGLWQVESRSDEHFDDRVTLDLDYIDRWSLALDLKILARTIPAVFARPGS